MQESELYLRLEALESRVQHLSRELSVACARIQTLEARPGHVVTTSLTYNTTAPDEGTGT